VLFPGLWLPVGCGVPVWFPDNLFPLGPSNLFNSSATFILGIQKASEP
jgi:hypothetical protein